MTLRRAIAAVVGLLMVTHAATAVGSAGFWRSCPKKYASIYAERLIPDVSWDLWRRLLGMDWSAEERRQPQWFEPDRMLEAAHAVPGAINSVDQKPYHEWKHFSPPAASDPAAAMAYTQASTLFHAGRWSDAEAAFTPLAESNSPLRAAAAYSAARAALNAGDVAGGIHRIGALLADPADAEMYDAAHDLLGTMSYHTGALPLLATRLSEISHLLMAPADLRCHDASLAKLAADASEDLGHVLEFTLPDRSDDAGDFSEPRRGVFTAVGGVDPVIDLVRVLAIPSPFSSVIWKEPFLPQLAKVPGASLSNQATLEGEADYAASAQGYARRMAAQTGNPLWAYALARLSADPHDAGLIAAAEDKVSSGTDDADDRRMLAAWLRAQRIRILLMSGRRDAAAAVISRDVLDPPVTPSSAIFVYQTPMQFVAEGGTRFLLASGQPIAAHDWAASYGHLDASNDVFEATTGKQETILTWDEVLAPGMHPVPPPGGGMSSAAAAMLDLLPADRLVALGPA